MTYTYSDLAQKTILVTGASRGIGKEISLELARQKANIVFNYRDENKAQILKEEIENLGGKAFPLKFDIKNKADIDSSISKFLKENAPIEGLVNNAGITVDNLLMRLKEEDISSVIDTNLKGTIFVTQALTSNFLRAKEVSIVNISSVVGLMGNAGQTIYSASKAGIIGFTKSLAKELGSRNVRVNAICPGFIETDMTASLKDEIKSKAIENIPLKRIGSTKDIASTTCFLLSNASSYITGEILKIDGGLYI